MAVTLVNQTPFKFNATGSSNNNVTIPTPAAGNTLVLLFGTVTSSAHATAVSGGGVTWTQQQHSSTNCDVESWTGPNSSGSGTTITITVSNTFAVYDGTVLEYSGMPTTVTVDGSAISSGNTGASGNVTCPSVTPNAGKAMVILIFAVDGTVNITQSPTGGFTGLSTTGMSGRTAVAHQIISSSTGSYSSTIGTAATFTAFESLTLGLDGSSGGGAKTPYFYRMLAGGPSRHEERPDRLWIPDRRIVRPRPTFSLPPVRRIAA